MIVQEVGEGVVLIRLDDGQVLPEALIEALKGKGITSAVILNGIGMLRDFKIGWFNVSEGRYEFTRFEEPYELLSLQGNVSLRDGEPFAHVHVVLSGSDKRAVGGHLSRGVVCNTLEMFVVPLRARLVRGGSGSFRPLEVQ